MDIRKLMSRVPVRTYPVAEARYIVCERDGGKLEDVRVTRVRENEVEFEYTDGVRHRVSPEYFTEAVISQS